MGRAFLSSKYEPARPVTPVIPHPPKYLDAPFDLDSDIDSDDVVYEAFCTPEEYKDHVANQEVTGTVRQRSFSPPSSAPSPPALPVSSVVRDERARTLPYFPTFVQRLSDGREVQTESPLPNLPRLVAELRPVLSRPEVRAALPDADIINSLHSSETQEEIHQRVIRIRQALRPHILAFLRTLPMTSDPVYIAGLVERGLVLDALGARGLDYFEAITRLGEHEGLEGPEEGMPTVDASGDLPVPNDATTPQLSLTSRINALLESPSSAPNITINPSEWWLSRAESSSPPPLPVHIHAEFAPSLGPAQNMISPPSQNYLVQDPDASDSSGSSRPDSPMDDPLPPRPPRLATGHSGGFVPRLGFPSSGQMFAAFTDMANADGISRSLSDPDWYNYPLYSGPLR